MSQTKTATSPAPAPSQEELDLRQSTILIVDDNVQNVELLQAYLESLPCKIITAFDGAAAMKIIEDALAAAAARTAAAAVLGSGGVGGAGAGTGGSASSGGVGATGGTGGGEPKSGAGATGGGAQGLPDLILLDVMMPKMSGFEVCRKIKEDPATRSIPIMMVTALNELGDIERGVESGTDDFLTKPVNKLELLTRVKSLLRVRHLKRELDRTVAYIHDIESRNGGPGQAPAPGGGSADNEGSGESGESGGEGGEDDDSNESFGTAGL